MVLGWGSKKAQVQHDDDDMSMEEILASIRKYVAEETPNKVSASAQNLTSSDISSPYRTETAKPQTSTARPTTHSEEPTFSPTNSFEDSSLFTAPTIDSMTEEYPVTRETFNQKTAETPSQNPFAKLAEISKKDISSATAQATEKSGLTLDQLIADLAKPMIQKWVDQNLSRIVEKMIADEIAKMTRS